MTQSSKIIQAILEVREKAPLLHKDNRNEYQKYNFVSIDQFYETIKPLATKAGLMWRARLVEWDMERGQNIGNNGSVLARVAFDLYHKDGEQFDSYMEIPIINGIVGAQTTGQVMSYAEKVFMRAAFGVATGESDGDDQDQAQFSRGNKTQSRRADGATGGGSVASRAASPPADAIAGGQKDTPKDKPETIDQETGEVLPWPEEASKNKDSLPILDTRRVDGDGAVETVKKIFETFMTQPKTKRAMRNWLAENLPALEKIDKIKPGSKKEVTDMITKRANTLPE